MSNFISCINTMLSPLSKPKGKGDNKGDDQGDGTDTDTNGQDGQQGDSGDQQGDSQKGDSQDGDSVNETPTNTTNDPNQKGGNGAGGGVSEIPQSLLDQIKNDLKDGGSQLLDNNSAFEQAVADKIAEIESTCLDGEKPYIVGDTSADKINLVREGSSSKGYAQQLLNDVREQTNYLRSSLRQMVRAMEHTNVVHGTRRGHFLSNRTLVDTALSMRNSRVPQRAFYNTDDQVDTSIACAICLDESGSMGSTLTEATKMLIALTEPIDQIGGKVLAYGFRNTWNSTTSSENHPVNSHRHEDYYPLVYDVFKSWNERFTTVKGRFAHTIADGSTPMSDGIQFGLDQIKYRTEKHRIIFVLTDGEPNYGHAKVIKWQQRVAKEMGIHIVGVGWGNDASGVKTLYTDNVWCQNVEDVPSALVSKLRSLLKERVRRKVS